MSILKTDYPEHDKMHFVKDESQTIGEFLDWLLNEKGIQLGQYHKHDQDCLPNNCNISEQSLLSVYTSIDKLLAEFFKIDLKKIEREKQRMLKAIRNKNKADA